VNPASEPDPSFQPDAALVAGHAGVYSFAPLAPETDVVTIHRSEEGRLTIALPWAPNRHLPVLPLNSDSRFACSQGVFTIEATPDGGRRFTMNGWVGRRVAPG
jgi:hypothetical protein